jgi:predicted regulator of Ras-like GTPase activity (Roadblock/LC7/MglB family)
MFMSILGELNGSSKDILASSLLSKDGLPMATVLPDAPARGIDEDRISALSAALVSCGHRVMADWIGSDLDWLLVRSETGSILITRAGPDMILAALIAPSADAEPIFPDLKRAADRIRELATTRGDNRVLRRATG